MPKGDNPPSYYVSDCSTCWDGLCWHHGICGRGNTRSNGQPSADSDPARTYEHVSGFWHRPVKTHSEAHLEHVLKAQYDPSPSIPDLGDDPDILSEPWELDWNRLPMVHGVHIHIDRLTEENCNMHQEGGLLYCEKRCKPLQTGQNAPKPNGKQLLSKYSPYLLQNSCIRRTGQAVAIIAMDHEAHPRTQIGAMI